MRLLDKSLLESLPSSVVNIEEKTRGNLFSWRGQFSPQLIEKIIEAYGHEGAVLLDPFVGSGTVLYESACFGLDAYGCEINPAAVSFSRVYELVTKPKEDVLASVIDIDIFVSHFVSDLPLFSSLSTEDFKEALVARCKSAKYDIELIILRALVAGMDFEAKKTDVKRINNVWAALRSTIELLPYSSVKIKCFNSDARAIPLPDESVDLVISSPPYINVFNYHQNFRKSIEALGVDVLSVAKSEIGANRKYRQNRFMTVVQYAMDMYQVFLELRRVCTKDVKMLLVVGVESNVRKTSFKNSSIIKSVAALSGFDIVGEQVRSFRNKFGEFIFEDVMRFRMVDLEGITDVSLARDIGVSALEDALLYCDDSVVEEIKSAIMKAGSIMPSPQLTSGVFE
nr:DNA methyltransferase [Halomonas sp. GFAJ-1]